MPTPLELPSLAARLRQFERTAMFLRKFLWPFPRDAKGFLQTDGRKKNVNMFQRKKAV